MSKTLRNTLLDYLRLMRISNAPTAMADVIMGITLATGGLLPIDRTLLLLFGSLSLYHAGMALNDVADIEQDRKERPQRPLPAGNISLGRARQLGYSLLLLGLAFCTALCLLGSQWLPLLISCCLATSIIAYNSSLKRTKFGPWIMGLCRGLNGALGLSLAGSWSVLLLVVPGVVAYVAGFTLFARDEAQVNSRGQLFLGALIAFVGIIYLFGGPYLFRGVIEGVSKPLENEFVWQMLWATIVAMVGRHFLLAIVLPTPKKIQRAVVGAIQGLIIINAALIFGYVGVYYGMMVMALLPISKLLVQWFPST